MTAAELAELRGELFGLKVLLMNNLTQTAHSMPNPVAYLDDLAEQSYRGVAEARPTNISANHLRKFQDAAAGIIVQAVEAAKVPHVPTPPRGQLQ
jgi:hypothetical protein